MSNLVRDWRDYLGARKHLDNPPPPYSAIEHANNMAGELERKDAAIAELVTALRMIEFEASPIHGDRGYHEKVYSLAIDALAKYDHE